MELTLMDEPLEGAVGLLAQMVRLDTVNPAISGRPFAEQQLVELLHRRAHDLGLAAHRLPVAGRGDNLLVSCEKRPEAAWLLFECHLDTVGVEGMAIEPFAGQRRDGRLHGRGACDAKGSGAAMLWALATYASLPVEASNVGLLFSVDEEVSRAGIDAFTAHQLATLGWWPAGAIVGEPTGLRLVVAHQGDVRLTIATEGRAAHSSDPGQGRSAIRMMLPILEALETRYLPGIASSHPLTGPAHGSLNLIRGGSAINVIPAACEIGLDRRIVPGEDSREVIGEIERLLDGLRAADPDLVAIVRDTIVHPALDPRSGEPFARHVAGVLAAMGLDEEPMGVRYGTHASTLAAAGIPAVVLGPGRIEQAHAADEWLDLDELGLAARAYLAVMTSPLPKSPPTRWPPVGT